MQLFKYEQNITKKSTMKTNEAKLLKNIKKSIPFNCLYFTFILLKLKCRLKARSS